MTSENVDLDQLERFLASEEVQRYVDEIRRSLEQILETIRAVFEEIRRVFREFLLPFLRRFENQTRNVFIGKLMRFGLPFGLSGWIAYKWPRRWLPYKWIWSG